jgi:N-acetylglutamate synthase-like GNAT family acetyltransferase
MKVRLANKFDLPVVLDMLRNFRNHTPIDMMRECNNEEYINKLFHHVILGGGVALIAEDKDVAGMIIGVKDQNVWDPEVKVLRELVYWVEPQYRGSTAGYKLLLRYNKLAQELIDEQKINMYTMTKMVNSPDLDFTRFGYKKTEEVWVAGV